MKKVFVILLSLFGFAIFLQAQQVEVLPQDEQVLVGHLDNGLTYYIRHNEMPKQRADFYIVQAVGAILEEDSQNGLAHFLEHMAFNGTEHFPGKGIINYFETVGVSFGGNINAFTSLDETVYHLSNVPTIREGIIDSALLVMHDWSHSLLLQDEEIDSERGVIREEWRTRASAERRMWSKLNPLVYPGSQYAKRDVIGDTAVINNFDYQELRDYYHKWYGPDLQAVIVVGDIDVATIENKIKELWRDVPARENRGERPLYTVDDNKEPIVAIVRDEEAQLTRISLDYKKQQLPQELKQTNISFMQDLYNELICTMFRNRLSDLAQQPDCPFMRPRCAYVEMVKLKDAFSIDIVAKAGKEEEAYKEILLQTEKMHRYGFTQSEYELAKKEILTDYEKEYNERQSVQTEHYVWEYASNFLFKTPITGIEWEYQMIQQILPLLPLDVINELAMSLPTKENVIISLTAPEKEDLKLPSEDELRSLFLSMEELAIEAPENNNIDFTLVKQTPKAGKIKSVKHNKVYGTTEWLLANGVKVIIKPTAFKQDEILLTSFSDGGLSMEPDAANLPSDMYAAHIVNRSGLGDLDFVTLQKALKGKHAGAIASINQYSEQIEGESSVKDFETMLQLVYLYFTAPRRDEDAYRTIISTLETQLKNKATNPKAAFRDTIVLMSSDHSERTVIWSEETLKQLNLQQAYKFFCERFADAADFTFIFTGNINPDDADTQLLIRTWLGSLKTGKCKKQKEQFVDRKTRTPQGKVMNYFQRQMQIHQTSNNIQITAPMKYNLRNDANMETVGRVLDMRYLESVREREGGTYGVGVSGMLRLRPIEYALLYIQFDTDPEKENKLMQIIYEEIQTILKEGPRADDVNKAKENMLKEFEEAKQKNEYWASFIEQYYHHNINIISDYEQVIQSISQESVRQTLQELWDAGNCMEIVMEPAK